MPICAPNFQFPPWNFPRGNSPAQQCSTVATDDDDDEKSYSIIACKTG